VDPIASSEDSSAVSTRDPLKRVLEVELSFSAKPKRMLTKAPRLLRSQLGAASGSMSLKSLSETIQSWSQAYGIGDGLKIAATSLRNYASSSDGTKLPGTYAPSNVLDVLRRYQQSQSASPAEKPASGTSASPEASKVGTTPLKSMLLYPCNRDAYPASVSIGLLNVLTRMPSHKVGYFRFAHDPQTLSAIEEAYKIPTGSGVDLEHVHQMIHKGYVKDLQEDIVQSYEKFRRANSLDFVLLEGFYVADHSFAFNGEFNAMISRMTDSPFVVALDVHALQSHGTQALSVKDIYHYILDSVRQVEANGAKVTTSLVYRSKDTLKLDSYIKNRCHEHNFAFAGALPYDTLLEAPQITDISHALDAQCLNGEASIENIVRMKNVVIATMNLGDLIDFLRTKSPMHVICNRATKRAMQTAFKKDTRADDDVWRFEQFKEFIARNLPQLADQKTMEDVFAELDLDGDGVLDEEDMECAHGSYVVIVDIDRIDILLGLLAADKSSEWSGRVGAIVLTSETTSGVARKVEDIWRLVDGYRKDPTSIPILLAVNYDTFTAAQRVARMDIRISDKSSRKIERARVLFDRYIDTESMMQRIGEMAPETVVSARMFEHMLFSKVREKQRHVVLAEGEEENILLAAAEVLSRGLAKITLLGNREAITDKARLLKADISDAVIIDPSKSDKVAEYEAAIKSSHTQSKEAEQYSKTAICDPNVFGTLMVKHGDADALLTGYLSTTFATAKQGLKYVGLAPGTELVSSVLFMLLPREVLVYADCALNPDPSSEDLASIAISSAKTAMKFGITPRIAMLSYATGTSNSGPLIDKVRKAYELVRVREPSLACYGPLQYDAATNPTIAKTKVKTDTHGVAGRANILIFPDLNTGNNAYKAVQNTANAVAIGPLIQGLDKMINDVPRNATVQEVVDTIVATSYLAE